MKKLYTLFILISISTVAYTQSHDENFGNPPSQMPLSNYTGWTSSLHFSGTAMIDTANPSLIDYTANYGPFSLASGAGNVSLNTVGSYLQVSSPYNPMIVELTLRFVTIRVISSAFVLFREICTTTLAGLGYTPCNSSL